MIGTSLTESLEGTCRRRRRAGAGRLGALLLLVLAARPIPATAQVAARRTAPLLMARPATAQTCFADTGNLPGNISCTANDVQTSLIVTPVGGDTCDSRVDTITLDLVITWHANADRYDIGLFVAEDGGNAKTGVCEQIVGQFPPFADLDDSSTSGDTCGDIEGGTDVVEHETVTVSCGAADANNHLLVPICTTWKQPGDNGLCLGINDTAGTSSKCDCFLWSTDVPVPPDPCANINCAAFDTGCTTASCDPGGAAGNCDVTTPKPSGTSCGNPTPTDAQCDAPDTCDGAGTCQSNNVVGICGDAGSDCVNQDYCQGGVCVDAGFKASGTACGNSSSGPCDAADTCNGAGSCQANNAPDGTNCGDAGSACVNQDTCLAGACHDNGFKAAGTACGDPSSSACDNPDTCDGSGSCQANNAADGTNCGDAGSACVNQDTCLAGACHDNGFKAPGTACGDPSSSACDNPDTCDGSGSCQANHAADGTSCGDAGTQCTNQDTCLAGACHDNGFKAVGTACGDQNSGQCDSPDTCDGSGTCLANHAADGTNCGDAGTQCTNQDTCLAGACHDNGFKAAGIACGDPSSGQCDGPDTCDGAGTCQANHAADGTNCGDAGTQCTNQDTCLAGACHDNGFKAVGTACGSSSSGQCDDPDTCDGSGTCTPNHKPDGTNCGDAGTQCTNQDTCLAGACHDNGFKAAGTACGDPSSGVCDNPDTCNGSGTCNPNYQPAGTVCRPSTNQDCNPAEVCTGNSPICPADTGDVCGFRDIPQMAITGTTCQQFTGGTSVTEGPVLYTLLNNAINSVAPGVFFLYDGIHLAATGTIAVTESEGSWSHAIGVQQSQVILYNLSCTRLTVGKIQVGTNGNVTITGVPAGNYILSVKYDPTTLNGYKPPTVNSTYTYSVTAGGLTSGNGSVFVDKKH